MKLTEAIRNRDDIVRIISVKYMVLRVRKGVKVITRTLEKRSNRNIPSSAFKIRAQDEILPSSLG